MSRANIVVVVFVVLGLFAIIAVNALSGCKVPDENKCGLDPLTSEPLVPYCESGLGEPVCKKVKEVCGEPKCGDGQTIDYCDYKNKKWVCKDSSSGGGDSPDVLCNITDDTLPYPRAWGNKIQVGDPEAQKPVSNWSQYKEITISGVKGCQLTSCKDGFKPYNDSSFCVPSDLGQPCSASDFKQSPNDTYSLYPDENATWVYDYKYPDPNTKYCKFNECKSGYVFDKNTKKCVSSSGDLPWRQCGTPPEHAETYRCRSDGFIVDKCKSPYTVTSDLKACELKDCGVPCAKPENSCVLSPTNLDDIHCSVYGNQDLGVQKTAILTNAASNGNVFLTKEGELKAKVADINNPWGGCGNKDLPGFVVDENGKCVEAFVGSGFKFNPIGSDKPGCVECPPLVCPLTAKNAESCKNFMEGCTRVELSGEDSWVDQCKADKTLPLGYSWGSESDGYLPVVCTDPPCDVKMMNITLWNNAYNSRVWVRVYDEINKTYISSEVEMSPTIGNNSTIQTFEVPRIGGGLCVRWETFNWIGQSVIRKGYVNNATLRSWCGSVDQNGNCSNGKKGLWNRKGSFVVGDQTPCP